MKPRFPDYQLAADETAPTAAGCPEQALACAVLLMALEDATMAVPANRNEHGAQYDGAGSFVFDQVGQWAEARRLWCDMAGIDADQLRREALRRQREASMRRAGRYAAPGERARRARR